MSIPIHRLLALAWLDNDNYMEKCVVDHIDNNSLNNQLSNLRWVSIAENNKKAITDQKIPVELHEITSHQVYSFNSIGEATRFLGKSIGNIGNPLVTRPGRIWETSHGNYELRILNSKPWYYTTKKKFERKNVLLIINGEFTYYKHWKEIPLHFSLNPDKFHTVDKLKEFLKTKYNTVDIKNIKTNVMVNSNDTYEIKNIITKEIISCDTIPKIAKKIGANSVPSAIYNRILTGRENLPYRGWLIRVKSNSNWADDDGTVESITNESKPIIAVNQYGQKEFFPSKKELGRKFNLTNHQINQYLESKKPLIFRSKIYTLEIGPV